MKHRKKNLVWFLLLLMIFSSFSSFAAAEEEQTAFPMILEVHESKGIEGSFVRYPILSFADPEKQKMAEVLNAKIADAASLPAYQQLLATITPGSTGLQMDFEWAMGGKYISILFSAQGKMLQGRPGQRYYPIVLSLETGEGVPFDSLFDQPDEARQWIEAQLTEEIEPLLSTYLENSDLFPVPYDRFSLDGQGNLTFYYEPEQLSFLSGFSGAVSFRYHELCEFLNAEEGTPFRDLWTGNHQASDALALSTPWPFPDKAGFPPTSIPFYFLGAPLENTLSAFRNTTDSGFYPDGACYEVEEARLRGTLILTDPDEEIVTGILSSRLDFLFITTGSTSLADASTLLGMSPEAELPFSADAAELYKVCPGTAALYSLPLSNGQTLGLTLYGDEEGIVQFIKLALE